jgi:hypothetical protein
MFNIQCSLIQVKIELSSHAMLHAAHTCIQLQNQWIVFFPPSLYISKAHEILLAENAVVRVYTLNENKENLKSMNE